MPSKKAAELCIAKIHSLAAFSVLGTFSLDGFGLLFTPGQQLCGDLGQHNGGKNKHTASYFPAAHGLTQKQPAAYKGKG